MKNISLEDVLIFHEKIIKQTGGSYGIIDIGLIESALSRAFASFDGKEMYVTLEEKISVTTHALINNHGFVDGNKRIGIAVLLLLLRLNRIEIKYTQQELIKLGLGIANGSVKQDEILEWIQKHKVTNL